MWDPPLATFGGVYTGKGQLSVCQVNGKGTPTVEGDSEVAASVGHFVHAKVIGHIGDRALLVDLLRNDPHWLVLVPLCRELVPGLRQVSPEDLHQAMSVAVVVNGARLARRPDEHKLGPALVAWKRPSPRLRGITYQVALPIPFVDEVPGVAPPLIPEEIRSPSFIGGVILLHQSGEVVDVNVRRGQARRRAQRFLKLLDELLEHDVIRAPGPTQRGRQLGRDGHLRFEGRRVWVEHGGLASRTVRGWIAMIYRDVEGGLDGPARVDAEAAGRNVAVLGQEVGGGDGGVVEKGGCGAIGP